MKEKIKVIRGEDFTTYEDFMKILQCFNIKNAANLLFKGEKLIVIDKNIAASSKRIAGIKYYNIILFKNLKRFILVSFDFKSMSGYQRIFQVKISEVKLRACIEKYNKLQIFA